MLENKGEYNWAHTIGEVVNILTGAGLTILRLDEYPFNVDNRQMAFVERGDDGYSRRARRPRNRRIPRIHFVSFQ